jgi:2-oxoglutarate ferredoxin oxidoreductase subunit gamma
MAELASREIEIRLCGVGGQGLLVAGAILAEALTLEGLRVAQSQSFEPTSRGGMSRTDLVASDGAVDFPLATALDCALILDQIAAVPTAGLVKRGGLVLLDRDRVPRPLDGDFALRSLALSESAKGLGDARVANLVGLGALTRLAELCSDASLERAIRSASPARFIDLNLEAARAGRSLTETTAPAGPAEIAAARSSR